MKKIVLSCFIVSLTLGSFSGFAAAADYLIGKGDVLEVSVWGVPEMSRSVTVRPDGKITLPAVGDVLADRSTPANLSKTISTKMKEYIKQPIVTVSVQQIINNRVYITGGGVSRVFDMTKETSLLKLLSELGDLSTVDLRRAYLSRNNEKINTDFYRLYFEGDMSQDIQLKAEDIIFIPSNRLNIVYVMGAVTAPQSLQFYEGMKVMDAILTAGGFTEFAKEGSVFVIGKDKVKHQIDLKKVTKGKDISANVALKPGDYVIVEESIF
ncbi:polysaccharide export outer membrane protein [Desulfuromusa kysingii]|uniref:Polysaccharide export outer membrane protein n=1 Tax=Desulfuromusa kysingii TaxID=37625 RepID=A0A1H4B8M5_9BACT|nr:polysaccharide biosynthesis/export family protein [Desulfuromusa kysingii]SEA44513.1 polysaccharide export outer membrane protein [Desulfuromusa kysingii]